MLRYLWIREEIARKGTRYRGGGLGEVSSYDTNAEGDNVCGRTCVDSSAKHKTETEPTVIGSTIKKDN